LPVRAVVARLNRPPHCTGRPARTGFGILAAISHCLPGFLFHLQPQTTGVLRHAAIRFSRSKSSELPRLILMQRSSAMCSKGNRAGKIKAKPA
jgi:hypothetical protein